MTLIKLCIVKECDLMKVIFISKMTLGGIDKLIL